MRSWASFFFGDKKTTDQRKAARYPVQIEARLNSESVSNAKAQIANLSPQGCYIKMLLSVEPGEKMQVNMHLPTGTNFTVNAVVVFSDPHIGFGVKFDLTDNQKEFLQDLIEFAREDA